MAARGRHPFSHQYWLATTDRAVKSTGEPKKATPKGTPTFFPVLLTALILSCWHDAASRGRHRFALSGAIHAITGQQQTSPTAATTDPIPTTPLIPRGPKRPVNRVFSPLDKPFHITSVVSRK